MPMKRMLPVRFGCVRVFQPGAIAIRVTARTLRQSLSSMVVDIDLWDENGTIVATAQNVRLVEAPAELATDPKSLTYHTAAWHLERAGKPVDARASRHVGAGTARRQRRRTLRSPASAGGRNASRSPGLPSRAVRPVKPRERQEDDGADDRRAVGLVPPTRRCSGISRRRISRSIVDGVRDAGSLRAIFRRSTPSSARSCFAIPTMGAEAASVSRLENIIGRLSDGDPTVASELGSPHWRNLGEASNQIGWLRDAVVRDVVAALSRHDSSRLVAGADGGCRSFRHGHRSRRTLRQPRDHPRPTSDDDRLEQARAAIGDGAPLVRCLTWSQLETLRPASLDLAFAVDALSEIAAGSDDGMHDHHQAAAPRRAAHRRRTGAQCLLGHRPRQPAALVGALGQRRVSGRRVADRSGMDRRTRNRGLQQHFGVCPLSAKHA